MRVTEFNKRKKNTYDDENTCKTLNFALLTVLLNIFGLKCNTAPRKNKLFLTRIISTLILFGTLVAFVIYYKMKHVNHLINISVRITDTIQTIYDYFQYIIDLIYVYKYGGNIYCEYYKQYATIDDIIGKGNYNRTIKNRLTKITSIFITVWLISTVCDFIAWTLTFGWKIPVVYALAYLFLLIRMLTTLDIISQVLHVQCRVRMVGIIVYENYTSADNLPGVVCDFIQNENWFYSNNNLRECKQRKNIIESNRTKNLVKCYLILTEQCLFINQMFGVRILLNSLSSFIDMVRFTNIAVRLIIGSQLMLYDTTYFPIASTFSRLLTCAMILVTLVAHCENTYRDNDKITFIIDHMFVNKNLDSDLRMGMAELRGLVQSRPVNFHLANFFRVDYSLLLSTASLVVTYSIILLQSIN